MTFLAPRIVLDVSYVTRINHEIHFAWQAQYLVKLECHSSWQARQFWEIAGARNCIFPYKIRLQDGTGKVSEADSITF